MFGYRNEIVLRMKMGNFRNSGLTNFDTGLYFMNFENGVINPYGDILCCFGKFCPSGTV